LLTGKGCFEEALKKKLIALAINDLTLVNVEQFLQAGVSLTFSGFCRQAKDFELNSFCKWEARWPHGLCARLWIDRVRDLDIALCSWARHFTLTVPHSTQVYKWVPANLMLGVTLQWTSIPSRGE